MLINKLFAISLEIDEQNSREEAHEEKGSNHHKRKVIDISDPPIIKEGRTIPRKV